MELKLVHLSSLVYMPRGISIDNLVLERQADTTYDDLYHVISDLYESIRLKPLP